MDHENMESALNLAMESSKEMREWSDVLSAGYDETTDSWEIIIKYNGNLEETLPQGITLEPLIAGYGILTVPDSLLEDVPPNPQIEYAELPKRLYFEQEIKQRIEQGTEQGMEQGIDEGLTGQDFLHHVSDSPDGKKAPETDGLTGRGVLIAIIDSGIDYTLANFRNADGTTRIAALWDQTLTPDAVNPPPQGFAQGRLFTKDQISDALRLAIPWAAVPSADTSGHGTAVAGIAASCRMEGEYAGIAPESELLIVKLGNPADKGFPRTTELLRALTFSVRFAFVRNQPLVVNLSFGNSYGSHNGTSLLERFIDNVSEIGRTVICIGTGNEGLSGGRCSGWLKEGQVTEVEIQAAAYETNLSIQFWKNFVDEYDLRLATPNGDSLIISPGQQKRMEGILGNTRVLAFAG